MRRHSMRRHSMAPKYSIAIGDGATYIGNPGRDISVENPFHGYGVWVTHGDDIDPCWFVDGIGIIFWTKCIGHAWAMAKRCNGEVKGMGFDGEPVDLAE